jgi:ABC-type dipeptide/oligopeptide/nickel transport system ATPase component
MKYFLRQEDHLRQIRTQITSTVSIQKKLLLNPSLTVKEWLSRLKENTEPTSSFVRKKVQHQYAEALKGFKHLSKLNQWLDQWEHAMMLGEKYKIPQMSNGIWLQDLADVI